VTAIVSALPDAARALVLGALPALRAALDVAGEPDGALVLAHRDHAAGVAGVRAIGALRRTAAGHFCAAAPLGRVRALAGLLARAVAPALDEAPPPGASWCLVLAPPGAVAVPIAWTPRVRPLAPDDLATGRFLGRWPATRHLVDRLQPRLGLDGAAELDHAEVVGVFEAFLAIVDGADIAPDDMRAASAVVRQALPILRAAGRGRP